MATPEPYWLPKPREAAFARFIEMSEAFAREHAARPELGQFARAARAVRRWWRGFLEGGPLPGTGLRRLGT